MKWSETTEKEKEYYRNLVADYLDETINGVRPRGITKEDVEKYWKRASAYFNTDDELEFKEVEDE